MTAGRLDILCVGNAVADAVTRPVTSLPPRGRLTTVTQIALHGGGNALNSAIAASRLGLKAGVVTAVGNDSFGEFLTGLFATEGVDTTGLVRDGRHQTSATAVMVSPDGERSFLHCVGASAGVRERMVTDRLLRRARVLHMCGFNLMPALDGPPTGRVMARARRLGLTVSLDTSWDSTGKGWPRVLPCLPLADYFMPSYEEAREIFHESDPDRIIAAALKRGVRQGVVVKMGARGALGRERGRAAFHVPACRIRAVDATGAGDSCIAGILAGIIRGMDFKDAVRLGCAVGGLSVAGVGGVGKLLSLTQALRFARGLKANDLGKGTTG